MKPLSGFIVVGLYKSGVGSNLIEHKISDLLLAWRNIQDCDRYIRRFQLIAAAKRRCAPAMLDNNQRTASGLR